MAATPGTTARSTEVVTEGGVRAARAISAVLAAIVVVDAISVGAPGLALIGVPFLVAGLRLTRAAWWSTTLLLAFSGLFVLIGVNYMVASGFDAGWGDLLFVYGGTPLAVALAVTLLRVVLARRSRR